MSTKSKHTRGGAQPGAGRPVKVGNKLVEYDVALSSGPIIKDHQGVSLRHARRLIEQRGAPKLIGADREAELRALAAGPDAKAALARMKAIYVGNRYGWGFEL
jgi:hypothetical protein